MNFRRAREEEISVNLTPLIDVVFLLLIFFMVTTTFTRETQLEVELPQVQTENVLGNDERIDVVIDAQGGIEINNQLLINTQFDTLKRALETVIQPGNVQVVVITTDKQTPAQSLMHVMDAVGQLGHSRIAFAAQLESE
ncbi:MAG: biopolymer transporter ExbD [Natronospirillum sp.]|uniref:Biopolymer transporter ExbD n=1 Tax=Salinispirillum sp. LH 10-3-1 TaxID=2952525 RepID=A0AB38YC91_9GAMM